jgi:ATP-dependent RNA helicase DDX31/DBP7
VVLKSETGSGKTLAYLAPLIEYLSHKSLNEEKITRENGTYAIIFSPTRELCVQIEHELKKLLKLFYYVVAGTIMGGENPAKEKSRLRKGLTIIICTPGRFLYHLEHTSSMNLSHLSYLIFDEADRMLDLGFEREMNKCLSLIKKKCIQKYKQPTVSDNYWSDQIKVNFVSATLNQKIEALGAKLMESYATVGFDAITGTQEENPIAAIPK